MRKVSFLSNLLGLAVIYLFACGALNLSPGEEGYLRRFVAACHQPFMGLTPLAGTCIGVVFLVLVATLVIPSSRSLDATGRLNLSWPAVVVVALWVNALAVVGMTASLFVSGSSASDPITIGTIYMSAVFEACVGAVLAVTVFFLKRPLKTFLPALGIFIVGVAALGTIFWFGYSGPSHLPGG